MTVITSYSIHYTKLYEEALKSAVTDDKLSGVIVDVWEKEPEIDIPLMHMSYLATPHIAGYSSRNNFV